jgi:Glycosyl hydrolases family 35
VVPATASAAPAQTHKVTYDHYSFSLDGQRVWLWSAEFHYFRLPSPDLWRDQLEKLKAAGFNTVSVPHLRQGRSSRSARAAHDTTRSFCLRVC